MVSLTSYRYAANAHYVVQALKAEGIEATFVSQDGDESLFDVQVAEADLSKAQTILESLEIDDSSVPDDGDDYVTGMSEWSDNMYDPGHYTGGKTPHFLLARSNWKFFAPVYLIAGAGLIYVLLDNQDEEFDAMSWVWALVLLLVGGMMAWRLVSRK